MSDIINEFIETVGPTPAEMPSDDALHILSGLGRADVIALTSLWEEWPADVVRDTMARLAEIVTSDGRVEFDELFSSCLSHDDGHIRESSIVALTGNGDARLVETLVLMLRNDPEDAVREKSALALGAYADFAEAGRLTSDKLDRVRAILEDATDDASMPVAGAALVAYAGMPGDSPTEVIEAWCDRGDQDSDMMPYAFAAMGRSCERHWFPDVQLALDHPSARIRESATLAFGQLANPDDDLACLEVQLDDDDLEVQLAAVTALRTVGTTEARTMLASTATTNPEPSVQEAAVTALYTLKDEDDLRHAVTPEMEESGLYGGGGTATTGTRDIGRYDAPTDEGWGNVAEMEEEAWDDAEADAEDGYEDAGDDDEEEEDDGDIGEDLEDWYESEEFWRGMR